MSAVTTDFPKVEDAEILSSLESTFLVTGDIWESVLDSFDSPESRVPLGGFILSVYPVNGRNPSESEGKSCDTSFVLLN